MWAWGIPQTPPVICPSVSALCPGSSPVSPTPPADRSHLMSHRVYPCVLARRHSLQHGAGVHGQVFQRHEWIVFVFRKLRPDFTWPGLVFLEGVYLGLPPCWARAETWHSSGAVGVDGTHCTNLFPNEKSMSAPLTHWISENSIGDSYKTCFYL